MEIKPLTPGEIKASPKAHPTIINVVNELLRHKFDGNQAVILQDEIVNEFLKIELDYTTERIFKEKLMDFEPVFRNAGWKVSYDKPGYSERHYPARFEFSPKGY